MSGALKLRHLMPALVLCLAATPARADHEAEVWRSPFGTIRSVSANPLDGSCWVASGTWVIRYAGDGTQLARVNLWWPRAVATNPTDGSCWIADRGHPGPLMWSGPSEVVHVGLDGSELSRTGGFLSPLCLSVNPADGTCWVGDLGPSSPDGGFTAGQVVRLAADGTEMWRSAAGAVTYPSSVGVDPRDGSCWVGDMNGTDRYVVHLAADGTEMWRSAPVGPAGGLPPQVAVDAADGSVWAALGPGLLHFGADGAQLADLSEAAYSVSVDPTDGSVWIGCGVIAGGGGGAHLTEDGTELWRGGGPAGLFGNYEAVVVNPGVDPTDGSVWFGGTIQVSASGLTEGPMLAHLSRDGTVLWGHQEQIDTPGSPAVIPEDGSAWYYDTYNGRAVLLREDGTELVRSANSYLPLVSGPWAGQSLQSSPSDGSCWAIDDGPDAGGSGCVNSRLVRVQPDGTESAHTSPLPAHCRMDALAVDPRDASVWMTYYTPDSDNLPAVANLAHCSSSGGVLWSKTYGQELGCYRSVSLDPRDGSVWFVTASSSYTGIVHLDQNGRELWRGGQVDPMAGTLPLLVAASPSDGACWVVYTTNFSGLIPTSTDLVCFNADGSERWRRSDLCVANMAFDPVTDLCWIVSDMEIIILDRNGQEQWRTGGFGPWPEGLSVNPVDGSCWVTDSLNDQIVKLKLPGPFRDVPFFDWAAAYIAACVNAGIVGGYPDGWYHPHTSVTRDAMAVFIARALAGGDSNVPTGPPTATFPDVPVGFWAFKYVEYAKSSGVVGGYPNGTYGPTVTVDRATMAVFIARAMVGGDTNVPPGPSTAFFPDVPTGFWALKYVEYIRSQSVTGGYPDGHYHPEYVCTRDQMAVFVQRAFALPM